ncbi:MAG: phospholipid carrier-dependent glycosyltransferase [Thermomicrobiales bacterium]|nr:phospholipid carrier-dependent glycosyltransferase [Thermomicrobiales bacterium]
MSTPSFANRITIPLLGALVVLLAIWQFFSAVDDREFHRDEARWIHRAVYLRELLHPFSDYWDESTWRTSGSSADEIYRLRAQPPVGSYVIGIGMLLQGEPLPHIGYWNMDHDDAWNAERGNKPSDAQLLAARRTTAAVGVLTALLIYLIGLRLTNPVGAAAGAAFFALHPLAIYLATFAGSDITLIFFIALSAWLAARVAERPTWSRAILLGIAIGLGGGTKLSPLGIAIVLALLGVILIGWRWLSGRNDHGMAKKGIDKLGLLLLSTPFVAAATFVASYPYLWPDPIRHSRNLLDYRTWGMEVQSTLWTQVAISGPREAVQRSWHRFASEDWSLLGRFLGVAWPVELWLALIGAVILAWLIWKRGLASGTALIAVVLGTMVVITFGGMGVDWARYHGPILLAMAVCTGVTVGWVTRGLKDLTS